MKKKKLNDRGFTLVELIVIVSIVAILAGAMSYSVNQIFANQARKFAKTYDSLLSQCRVNTLAGAPSGTYVKMYQDSEGDYYGALYEGGAQVSAEKLGGGNLNCTVSIAGTEYALPADVSELCIGFDRSTGAFLELDDAKLANSDLSGTCEWVSVSSGGLGGGRVKMVAATGYHCVG